MGKFRRIDTSPGWINRKITANRRALERERAAKRLPHSEVPEGGNLFIRGILSVVGALDLTGTLSAKTGAGTEVIRIGQMEFGLGLELKREDGTEALLFHKPFATTDAMHLGLIDINGSTVVGENALGPGLGRPSLELPFHPVAATTGTAAPTIGPHGWERTHATTTWTTLFVYDGKAQNGFLDLKFAAFCSDGSTAGEIQVVDEDTGIPLAGFLIPAWVGSIVAGTTTYTIFDPTPGQVQSPVYAVGMSGQMRIGVQVRRTAGAGTITLAVPQAIGG